MLPRLFQKWNADSEKYFPLYKTMEEQNRPFWKNMGTVNFWADDVFKQSGFMAGALLGGMVVGSAGAALLNLNKTRNALRIAEGAVKAVETGTMGEVLTTTADINKAFTKAANAYKWKSNIWWMFQ